MSLAYRIGERTWKVRIEKEADGSSRVVVSSADGDLAGEATPERVFRAFYTPIEGSRALLVLDGVQHVVHVASGVDAQGDEALHVAIAGETHTVTPPSVVEKRRRAGGGSAEIGGHVTPPMPGQVVKVLVQPGERVEKGQAVVVIMAMKMETTLCAPHAGQVTDVRAAEGAQVKPGDVLIDIQKDT